MNYRDLNGEMYIEENAQDKFLRKLYTSVWGRAMLRPLVNPVFSRAAGAFWIPGFPGADFSFH